MKHSRLLISMALSLGLICALLCMVQGPSGQASAQRSFAPVPPSLARRHAPAIISGSLLSDLMGSPVDEIFVYAYLGTALTQIPFQIDERDAAGMYVTVEDGLLDENDEIVLMATDGGGWVDHPSLDAGGLAISPAYVATITDPISDTCAWVYVFYSDALSCTFTADYVSYAAADDRIASLGRYAMGFNATYAFRDYLTLGNSNVDLLDRDKLRITGTASMPPIPPFSISADEEDIAKAGVHVIDGPIRVTRVSTSTFTVIGEPTQITTTLFAYRSLVVQPTTVVVPGAPAQDIYLRTSVDWNEQASGMIYYDANNPAGVTIDGAVDTITSTLPTRWTQVAGITGTVVVVSKIPSGLGGTQSTYYRDDSAIDSSDTGDQCSYGDAGLQVSDPNPGTYATIGHIYFLTETLADVGATYVEYYDSPLQISVAPISEWQICLPLVLRTGVRHTMAQPASDLQFWRGH